MSERAKDIWNAELSPENINGEEVRRYLNPILKMVTHLCGTSVSLVNLIDKKEQKAVAWYGEWDEEKISQVQGISRSLSPQQNIRVINNFENNKELTTTLPKEALGYVKFYAEAPLKTEEGSILGSLCLFDSEPRSLTESQKEHLQTLADETVQRLQNVRLKQLLNEKERVTEKQSIFLKNSADITFVIEPENGKIADVNSDIENVLGYSPESLLNTAFADLVESSELVGNSIEKWFTTKKRHNGRYSISVRLKDNQNKKRWFQCNFTSEKGLWYVTARDISDQKLAESGIIELKEKFRKVVHVATDLIYELDWDSGDMSWGDELTDVLGYPNEERFVDYDWWIDKIHPDDLERVIYDVAMTVDGEQEKVKLIYRIKTYDGSYKYVMNHKYVDRNDDGSPDKIVGAIVDISDLKEVEDQAERNRKLLEELAGQTSTAIWVRDRIGKHLFMNQNYRSLFKLSDQNVVGKTVDELFDEGKARQFKENDQKVLESGKSHIFDESVKTEKGIRYYKTNIFPISGGRVGGVSVDITVQIVREKELKNSLAEKETLLKEIHHRVKNNLAVVSGMLFLQWYKEENEEVRKKLLDSTSRIKTMATIHEILYQSSSFTKLKLDDNIKRLIENITSTYEISVQLDIRFDLEPIELNINQAIPFSLIVNEVITNVLKHAFDEETSGKLSITLSAENDRVTLTIKDDGNGLPDDFDPADSGNTLGLELIETLATQLGAEYSYASLYQGTLFTLTFEKDESAGVGSSFLE